MQGAAGIVAGGSTALERPVEPSRTASSGGGSSGSNSTKGGERTDKTRAPHGPSEERPSGGDTAMEAPFFCGEGEMDWASLL